MSYMSERDFNTSVSYHPDLWAALGTLLRIAMNKAEGAEGHGLADCTDWLTEIGDALQGMNGSDGPYRLTVEDIEELEFDADHVLTNTGGSYGVNGKSLQAICAAGRITLVPVRRDQCPMVVAEVFIKGTLETYYEGDEDNLIVLDAEGRRCDTLRGTMLTDAIADDLDTRLGWLVAQGWATPKKKGGE
jgi:hypothetical protein